MDPMLGRWKAFVALYSHEAPDIMQALFDAAVLAFGDEGVTIEVLTLDEANAIRAERERLEDWLRDWFGHPVRFRVTSTMSPLYLVQ